MTPIEMGSKNNNDRFAYPETAPVYRNQMSRSAMFNTGIFSMPSHLPDSEEVV